MEEKTKKCSCCGQEKPLSEFYANPRCNDGHIGQCKKCKCERAKERRLRKEQSPASTPPQKTLRLSASTHAS